MALAESLAPSEIGLRGAQAFEHLAHGQYFLTPDASNLATPANMQQVVEPDFPGAQIGTLNFVPKMPGAGLKAYVPLHPDTGKPYRVAVNAGQPDLGVVQTALPGGAPGYATYSRRSQGAPAEAAPPTPNEAAPAAGAPTQAPAGGTPRPPTAHILKGAGGAPIPGILQDIPGQEYVNVQSALDGIRKIDRAIDLIRTNPKLVGPGAGAGYANLLPGPLRGPVRGLVERGKPGQAELDQLMAQIRAPELFGVGGKQLTGIEQLILDPSVFDPLNPPEVILDRLRNLRAKATRFVGDYMRQYTPERGYKPPSLAVPTPRSLQEQQIQRRLQSQYNP
jgi:hypothetical protein